MRRTSLLVAAAALFVATANLSAQGSNFSGVWVRDTTGQGAMMAGGGGGRGGFGGGPMTIVQDAKTMTVTQTRGQNEVKTTYNLDGSDSKNSVMGRGGEATDVISKAVWVGSALKVTTPGANGETVAIYSLDGGNLVIATTRPGRGGGDPTTMSVKYKKN